MFKYLCHFYVEVIVYIFRVTHCIVFQNRIHFLSHSRTPLTQLRCCLEIWIYLYLANIFLCKFEFALTWLTCTCFLMFEFILTQLTGILIVATPTSVCFFKFLILCHIWASQEGFSIKQWKCGYFSSEGREFGSEYYLSIFDNCAKIYDWIPDTHPPNTGSRFLCIFSLPA
jgi:hypothetical protein